VGALACSARPCRPPMSPARVPAQPIRP
jgi:hypothetical protein